MVDYNQIFSYLYENDKAKLYAYMSGDETGNFEEGLKDPEMCYRMAWHIPGGAKTYDGSSFSYYNAMRDYIISKASAVDSSESAEDDSSLDSTSEEILEDAQPLMNADISFAKDGTTVTASFNAENIPSFIFTAYFGEKMADESNSDVYKMQSDSESSLSYTVSSASNTVHVTAYVDAIDNDAVIKTFKEEAELS